MKSGWMCEWGCFNRIQEIGYITYQKCSSKVYYMHIKHITLCLPFHFFCTTKYVDPTKRMARGRNELKSSTKELFKKEGIKYRNLNFVHSKGRLQTTEGKHVCDVIFLSARLTITSIEYLDDPLTWFS